MTTLLNLVLVGGLLLLKSAACQDGPGWLSQTFDSRECRKVLEGVRLNSPVLFRTEPGDAVFWSTDISKAQPNPNMLAAQQWARDNNKKTLEMTVGGRILDAMGLFDKWPADEAAFVWNCASKMFAQQASGTMHAFARQLRTRTDYPGNGRPTFYNIELVQILNKNPDAQMVFHYSANGGRDVWYNSHHYTNCDTDAMERLTLFAKYTFAAYEQSEIPYPDYGLDDELDGEACPR